MRKPRFQLIAVITACIALLVLFLLLPKQPASVVNKSASADPDSVRLAQAVELVQGPAPMEGIKILQNMVEDDSTNVDAQFYLGAFSVKSGQTDKASKRLNTVLALRPNELKYLVEVGYQYILMDSSAKAIMCFDKALAIDETDNNSLFFSAKAHENLGNLKEAKDCYEHLLLHLTDTVVVPTVKEYISNIDKKLNP